MREDLYTIFVAAYLAISILWIILHCVNVLIKKKHGHRSKLFLGMEMYALVIMIITEVGIIFTSQSFILKTIAALVGISSAIVIIMMSQSNT